MKSETSQDLSQKFVHFVRTLEVYIADFCRAVEDLAFQEQPEKCRILENELVTAKADMDGVSKEVKELGCKFAGNVFVTCAFGLLTVLAPGWGLAVLGTAVSALRSRIHCLLVSLVGPPAFLYTLTFGISNRR